MKLKTYCVHIYPARLDCENIKAKSRDDAEEKALKAEGMNDWELIDHTEVMLTCLACETDNDTSNKTCESCGKKL